MLLYAIKGNKQLKIDEAEKDTYLKLGYDIAEAEGNELKTIETSPSKTVSAKQFEALQKENKALKEQLQNADNKDQIEALQSEIKDLKAQLAEAKKPPKTDK
jgi:gas vesicle protein